MDKKALSVDMDREYSPSSVAANYQSVIDEYSASSDCAMKRLTHSIIRYGTHEDEYIILFEPQARGSCSSLFVFFHGGYWQALSARDACFAAPMLNERGVAYAAVNYSLAPNESIATIVAQCIAAMKCLAARMPDARIVIGGSSAGAHLAAMLTSTDWTLAGMKKPPFSGTILISGIYDLRPLVGTYINGPLGLDFDSATHVSPMYQPLKSSVDTVVCWGEHETEAFKQQSLDYAGLLARTGVRTSMYEVKKKNHFDILFDLTDATNRLSVDTLLLLGEK